MKHPEYLLVDKAEKYYSHWPRSLMQSWVNEFFSWNKQRNKGSQDNEIITLISDKMNPIISSEPEIIDKASFPNFWSLNVVRYPVPVNYTHTTLRSYFSCLKHAFNGFEGTSAEMICSRDKFSE